MKILITDDAAFMRMVLKNALSGIPESVILEAANGAEAVQLAIREKPDLILMDITMPEVDGLEAVKQIRAAIPTQQIIMCSAMGQETMVIAAIQAGAADFIVKPFKPERILAAVQKALKLQ